MNKIKALVIKHPALLTLTALASQVFFSGVASAQSSQSGGFSAPPSTITTTAGLANLICEFVIFFFWIVIIVSVIMVLVAAFDYVTAGDDTEKTSRGRKRLTYAAVGVAVALIATTFPSIVASVFPNTPNLTTGSGCSILSF